MEDWKAQTRRAYETFPDLYEKRFAEHFQNRVVHEASLFVDKLPGPSILDLGSGPGCHAAYFQRRGCDVLCLDISPAMVERCRRKGLRADIADMENAEFDSASFDGVWAYASLLHLPKERIPAVIAKVGTWLKPRGILYLAFKQGEQQGLESHERFPGTQRWFSYVTDEEVIDWCRDTGLFLESFTQFQASARSIFMQYTFAQKT